MAPMEYPPYMHPVGPYALLLQRVHTKTWLSILLMCVDETAVVFVVD